MHTVIVDECTGCELCVAPCPVDCIHMVPLKVELDQWRWPNPEQRREIADTALIEGQVAGEPSPAERKA
jgi:electron transport complex protein RnfB